MKRTGLTMALALLAAAPLGAQDLRYASGFPPGGPVNEGLRVFAEKIAAGSDMTMKLYELSLLDLKRLELAKALGSGPRLLLLDEIAGGLTDAECDTLLEIVASVRDPAGVLLGMTNGVTL